VERWAGVLGLAVEEVDVDVAGLGDRFGDRVPVLIAGDGRVLAWGRMRRPIRALLGERFRRPPEPEGSPPSSIS
jgi:hypothetical protein